MLSMLHVYTFLIFVFILVLGRDRGAFLIFVFILVLGRDRGVEIELDEIAVFCGI